MPCKCIASVDVTIYARREMPETPLVQSFLDSKGIPYQVHDVSADPPGMEELLRLSGQDERPVVVVDGQVFVGFDRSQLDSAVPSFF